MSGNQQNSNKTYFGYGLWEVQSQLAPSILFWISAEISIIVDSSMSCHVLQIIGDQVRSKERASQMVGKIMWYMKRGLVQAVPYTFGQVKNFREND